jgi:putative Mn2+ efflux pump MntP
MIKESFKFEEINDQSKLYSYKTMIFESIATSIDALSSCVILPTIKISPYLTCLIIVVITFIFCLIGHKLGKQIGLKLKDKASILGGLILILLGVKCVLEHLNII